MLAQPAFVAFFKKTQEFFNVREPIEEVFFIFLIAPCGAEERLEI